MEAKLLWNSTAKDEDGFPVNKQSSVEIYAEEKEVTRAEFYESMRSGVTVKRIFEVRQEDFNESEHLDEGQRKCYASEIEVDGEVFRIMRTYKTGKSKIEVICGE